MGLNERFDLIITNCRTCVICGSLVVKHRDVITQIHGVMFHYDCFYDALFPGWRKGV